MGDPKKNRAGACWGLARRGLWWESSLLSASSPSEHPVAGFVACPCSGQPSISPEPRLTLGPAWALGLVGQAREGLFRAGKACLPSKRSIFSCKLQPGPVRVAFPLLWGPRSLCTCSGVPETPQLLSPRLSVSLALRVGVTAIWWCPPSPGHHRLPRSPCRRGSSCEWGVVRHWFVSWGSHGALRSFPPSPTLAPSHASFQVPLGLSTSPGLVALTGARQWPSWCPQLTVGCMGTVDGQMTP